MQRGVAWLLKWQEALQNEYLDTTAIFSQELRVLADRMDGENANRERACAKQVREKARFLGMVVPVREQADLQPNSTPDIAPSRRKSYDTCREMRVDSRYLVRC